MGIPGKGNSMCRLLNSKNTVHLLNQERARIDGGQCRQLQILKIHSRKVGENVIKKAILSE